MNKITNNKEIDAVLFAYAVSNGCNPYVIDAIKTRVENCK